MNWKRLDYNFWEVETNTRSGALIVLERRCFRGDWHLVINAGYAKIEFSMEPSLEPPLFEAGRKARAALLEVRADIDQLLTALEGE